MKKEHKIIIVGGGFAGVKCALSLSKKNLPKGTRIILVSDRLNFEYHGALYRIVTGHSPLEVCLPLREILNERKVEIVKDRIDKIDPKGQMLRGESDSIYHYDELVIALGAETVYFDVPGLKENAHGIKTIDDALRLKRHLHETFAQCSSRDDTAKICGSHFVVIGAGATGVEIAAELAVYTKRLAIKHNVDPTLVRIDLIESQSRILPTLHEKFAQHLAKKLEDLGVTIHTNARVTEGSVSSVHLKDMELKTKTIVWTAGVRAHALIEDAGLAIDQRGRAVVCSHLRAKGFKNIYVAGDAASTRRSGMAQTALQDGMYIARTITRTLEGKAPKKHRLVQSIYAVPVGPGWAGASFYALRCYGKLGWWVRRLVDMVVFLSFLPFGKACDTFHAHKRVSENCPTCRSSDDRTS